MYNFIIVEILYTFTSCNVLVRTKIIFWMYSFERVTVYTGFYIEFMLHAGDNPLSIEHRMTWIAYYFVLLDPRD